MLSGICTHERIDKRQSAVHLLKNGPSLLAIIRSADEFSETYLVKEGKRKTVQPHISLENPSRVRAHNLDHPFMFHKS